MKKLNLALIIILSFCFLIPLVNGTCEPPSNKKQTWTITDNQKCINQTICRLNNINITDTGSLTLQNTTLQFNIQSLYTFFINGKFIMDKDSLLLPPFSSCGGGPKPYPILAKIIVAQEISILPILYLASIVLLILLL